MDELRWLYQYIWIPIIGGLAHLYRLFYSLRSDMKDAVHSIDTAVSLLQHEATGHVEIRKEDLQRSKDARSEVLQRLEEHHNAITSRLQKLEAKIDYLYQRNNGV